jgi:hypothetical protein
MTSGLRIGDADREALAAELREHYAHGRLTLEEFQHRLDAAFAARTESDLRRITSDLPHAVASAAPWPATTASAGYRRDDRAYQQQRGRPRASSFGAFANVSWLLLIALLIVGLFGIFGSLAPKPLVILLAIIAFSRRLLRRLVRSRR